MKKIFKFLSLSLCMLAFTFFITTVSVNAVSKKNLMTKYLNAFKNHDYKKADSFLKKMKKTERDTSCKSQYKNVGKMEYKNVGFSTYSSAV